MAKHPFTENEIAEWRKAHGHLIYFNRDDSNLIVPKSYGFGRTFNWAHPVSWVIIAALVAFLAWSFLR